MNGSSRSFGGTRPASTRRRVVALVLVAIVSAAACTPGDEPASSASTEQLGVFRGAIGTAEIDRFATWLGRDIDIALTFVNYETWADIEGPDWFLDPWEQWKADDPSRRLVLSVAMLPGLDPADDETVAGEIRAGAAGAHDAHFRVLAERLVERGLGDVVLRIGWEANGDWYRWRAAPDPVAWIDFFRRIVETMRSVPGNAFRIDWSVSVPIEHRSALTFYPGDDVVDIVGIDVYDKSWREGTYPVPDDATDDERTARHDAVWNGLVGGLELGEGMTFWADFADERGKDLAVPEWGVVDSVEGGTQRGGLDHPAFVERMADWLDDHDVAYHVYFEFDSGTRGGDHQLTIDDTTFPLTASAFRARFGGRDGAT